MIEFLSGRRSGADTVVNVATVEFRFGAVVLIEKLVFNVAYEKTDVAGPVGSTPWNGLYWETPPKRVTFFRL